MVVIASNSLSRVDPDFFSCPPEKPGWRINGGPVGHS